MILSCFHTSLEALQIPIYDERYLIKTGDLKNQAFYVILFSAFDMFSYSLYKTLPPEDSKNEPAHEIMVLIT